MTNAETRSRSDAFTFPKKESETRALLGRIGHGWGVGGDATSLVCVLKNRRIPLMNESILVFWSSRPVCGSWSRCASKQKMHVEILMQRISQ